MAELEKQKKANEIVIDDGSKSYEIKNKQGKKLAEFSFRPADTNILARYEETKKFFDEFKIEEADDIVECQEKVIEQMDYLVGADTGNTFFSIMGPFSPMPDGSLFCEVCLNTVCNVISEEFDVRLEKAQNRVKKYTAKYHPSRRNYTKKRRHG